MKNADALGPKDVGKKIRINFKSGDQVIGTLKTIQQDLTNYQTTRATGLIEGIAGGKFGVATTVTLAIARLTMEIPLNGDQVSSFSILDGPPDIT